MAQVEETINVYVLRISGTIMMVIGSRVYWYDMTSKRWD